MLNLWYKNAVIYCVDVDAFQDQDGDGIGDDVDARAGGSGAMGDVSGKGARGGRGVVRLARRAVRGRRRGSDRRERDVQTDAGGAGDSRTKGAHVVRRVERGRGRTDERWDGRATGRTSDGTDQTDRRRLGVRPPRKLVSTKLFISL